MNQLNIIEKVNKLNREFSLSLYLNDHPERFDSVEIDMLDNCQKYELDLYQKYAEVKHYNSLQHSIIDWMNPQEYSLSNEDLIDYIKTRLSTELSTDRAYLYNELVLHFSDSKQKKICTPILLESLKKLILQKFDNDYELDLIMRLLYRLILISIVNKLEDEEFIKEFGKSLMEKINIEGEFYIPLTFFDNIFDMLKKKMSYFAPIEVLFDELTNRIDDQILNNDYMLGTAKRIASVYAKTRNEQKKIYFYKKDIDNLLASIQDISNSNAMHYLYILQEKLKHAKDIDYKFKEIKDQLQKVAKYISENYSFFFQSVEDQEMAKEMEKYIQANEKSYKAIQTDEERIDFIVFDIFHLTHYSTYYKTYLDHKPKDGLISLLFPTHKVIDHKGYSYTINDSDLFKFFQIYMPATQNLLNYLDYHYKWVDVSLKILQNDIKNLKMIDGYKEQFKTCIKSFVAGRYIEFIYISPVLIELLLKKYLISIGGDILNLQGKSEVVEKTFGLIIKELIDNSDSYLDENILRYISHTMNENNGINLRNNILHGNYPDGAFNKSTAMYLYIILIYLIRYFMNDQD